MKYLKHFANAQEAATILATWPFNTISSIQGQEGIRFSEGVPVGPVGPTDRVILKFMVTAKDWNDQAQAYQKGLTTGDSGTPSYEGDCFEYMVKDGVRIDDNFWTECVYFNETGEHTVELVFTEEFDGDLPDECFKGAQAYEIVIPTCITNIGYGAFYECIYFASVTIPNSVTSIGDQAFYDCTALHLFIPDTVISIGNDACYHVRHIEYHGSALDSPWGAFSMNGVIDGNFVFSDSTKQSLLAYIGEGGNVTIPSTVTTINSNAFYGCYTLTSVNIPNNVTSIGAQAFYNCYALTSVTIGNGVTTIGNCAFYDCYALTSVTIGSGVTSIGTMTFNSCKDLVSITCNAINPPSLGTDALYDTNDCPIYVPASSVDAYKVAENWTYYASRIQAIQ